MDWTQTFTIIGVFIALFVYMMSRIDSNQKENNKKFELMNGKIELSQKQLNDKIDANQKQTAEGFKQVGERFNKLENRMTSIEAEIKNTHQRINSTSQRISDFQMQVNQRFNTLENYILPKKVIHEEVKESRI